MTGQSVTLYYLATLYIVTATGPVINNAFHCQITLWSQLQPSSDDLVKIITPILCTPWFYLKVIDLVWAHVVWDLVQFIKVRISI